MDRIEHILILLFLSFNFVFCGIFPGNHYGILDKNDLPFELRDHPTGVVTGQYCNDKRQSPIDIKISDTKKVATTSDLTFGKGYSSTIRFFVENPGHTVQVSFRVGEDKEVTVTGSNIGGDKYKFIQFHYHWGKVHGSEHFIDGHQYAGELHLVHVREKYEGLNDALAAVKSDKFALMVLGILIEEDAPAPHPGFQKLSKTLCCMNNTKKYGAKRTNPLFGKLMLKKLLPTGAKEPIFTYDGSLTTAPCTEAVRWIVFQNPVKYTKAQMDSLRNLYNAKNENLAGQSEHNVRPFQPLNDREVTKHENIDMKFIE